MEKNFSPNDLSKKKDIRSNPTNETTQVIKREVVFELDDGFFDDPFFGSNETLKIIIIYTDLQCTQCLEFIRHKIPELKKLFFNSEDIQIRMRDFPLGNSPISKHLAKAAHCAGEKGAYWDFIREISENTPKDKDAIINNIKHIDKLDKVSFTECLNSNKYDREIEIDKEHAISLGIKGSPVLVIAKRIISRLYSGTIIRGNQPLDIILEELYHLK
jgi:protein-disulfide isomerase